MTSVIERFLRYVRIDTQSRLGSDTFPSEEKEKDLSRLLVRELKEMGAENPHMDEYGYVYAWIPDTTGKDSAEGPSGSSSHSGDSGVEEPVIGFISHVDTSDAVSGRNVKPRIIHNYNGKDIVLNYEKNIVMRTEDFPNLLKYTGQTLIVTDGTTLLGADDKAGIAEIMTMADYLLSHPEIPHRRIPIAFTPDEEVGRGVDYFDINKFGADYAYTVDGTTAGEIEYENFNAASAQAVFHGKSVHPGDAKGKMINAILLANEFQHLLPVHEDPSATDGYEGFYHPVYISGGVEEVTVHYIIRDHDRSKFDMKKAFFSKAADFLRAKYGDNCVSVVIKDSYYNMKEKIEPHMHLIDNATEAIRSCGLTPITNPVRGGTDGAVLSFKGLPCPNLGTGGENLHGRYEFACAQSMEKVVNVLLKIIEIYNR